MCVSCCRLLQSELLEAHSKILISRAVLRFLQDLLPADKSTDHVRRFKSNLLFSSESEACLIGTNLFLKLGSSSCTM